MRRKCKGAVLLWGEGQRRSSREGLGLAITCHNDAAAASGSVVKRQTSLSPPQTLSRKPRRQTLDPQP
jgi:hypothetical protein